MTVLAATCLGCGCTCDDIDVQVEDGAIVAARHACDLGVAWFGSGHTPSRTLIGGDDRPLVDALDAAAAFLSSARRPLVYLGPDMSCETLREAVACADALHACVDSVTSATALPSILAAQERGHAGATLGEIRNRADLLVFWGIDPALRYPRFCTRYAPEPAGMFVPTGRASRMVIAVDIGDRRGPADADLRIAVPSDDEIPTLTLLAAALSNTSDATVSSAESGDMAERIRQAKYVAVVADAEPERAGESDSVRAHALAMLAHAINDTTRGALSLLRSGGNSSGADAVLTAQTGYPACVDFGPGYPTYTPHASMTSRHADAALIVGAVSRIPVRHAAQLATMPAVIIGPRASESPFSAKVAIDTAVAGIHSGGTAVRMDDVPIPLRAVVDGPPDATGVCRALRQRWTART